MYLVIAICLAAIILIFTPVAIHVINKYRRTIGVLTLDLAVSNQNLEKRERIHNEILDIAHYVALNMEFDKTLQELLPKLSELTRSSCCAFYSVNNASKLTLKHSIGFGKNVYTEFDLTIGEGFIGSLALKKDITVVHDIPEDTIYSVRTFLGKIKPRSLMVIPVFHQEQLNGVLVCASVHAYTENTVNLVDMVKYYFGIAVGNGINAEKNKRLTNELAFQNKLIQNQHEEMRKRLSDKETLVLHLINMIEDEIAYVLDSDLKVLLWNNSARAIYGVPRENALGRHIDHIHAELGWDTIEKLLNDMPEEQEHSMWITGRDGKSQQFMIGFSQMGSDDSYGVVAKVRELDVRR